MNTETYDLVVTAPEADQSDYYKICVVQDDDGTYMATCRELPEVVVFDESKQRALVAAHTAIKDAIAAA